MSAANMDEPLAVREAPASYLVELEEQRVRHHAGIAHRQKTPAGVWLR